MTKYELKTTVTDASVQEFLDKVKPESKREDALELLNIFREVTGQEPKMWGPSIIGFGQYHYIYKTGHEGDMCATGFSPRKAKHSLYIMSGFDQYDQLMSRLGKHSTGKSCLYINKLADVDKDILKKLIREGYDYITNKTWP